ncbi:peptidyl-lysine N-acetyltransferase YjaB-like [Ptychodera flava]|uniref:peptidyl-lysine N-acetyltransferase YjaB-like n=1 Tax=Ptychodera flava TaxID=63121 RepID=UPI00396A98A6
MSGVEIRAFDLHTDLERVLDIWYAASLRTGPLTEGDLDRCMCDMRNVYFPTADNVVVAVRDDVVEGFVSMFGDYIEALFISPSRQRQGIGTRLLNHVKGQRPGNRLTIEVFEANSQARRFYKKHGFLQVGETEDISTGLPMIILTLCSR